jgi:uncharacterized DUF497 family protein
MEFEWDPKKAEANEKKHGVSFLEATTVFNDPLSLTFHDPDHSYAESRFIIIGRSNQGRTLFVSHTDRNKTVRIITARVATRQERKSYEEEN